ncbi:MAG: transposase [Bifidobacterium longum]
MPEDPPSWPDILRTIELGYSNARLEASDNRIKVTIRMAYGFHHANSLIALVMPSLRRQSWRKRQSRHAVIDIPPFNGIVITCALLKRMDRARSSAG